MHACQCTHARTHERTHTRARAHTYFVNLLYIGKSSLSHQHGARAHTHTHTGTQSRMLCTVAPPPLIHPATRSPNRSRLLSSASLLYITKLFLVLAWAHAHTHARAHTHTVSLLCIRKLSVSPAHTHTRTHAHTHRHTHDDVELFGAWPTQEEGSEDDHQAAGMARDRAAKMKVFDYAEEEEEQD